MQQFGLKRGPEVFAYQLSAQAVASLTLSVFVITIKSMGGHTLMFQICFLALVVASVCVHHLDDKTKIRYGDLYYEGRGLVGSKPRGRSDAVYV